MKGTAPPPVARVNGLGLKLLLITLVALVLLAAATAGLVTRSFRHSQREVTARSAEALEAQGRDALVKLLQREREIGAARLQQGAATSQLAAQYLVDAIRLGDASPGEPGQLTRGPAGQWFDASPARASEVFIPNGVTALDAALERDRRE